MINNVRKASAGGYSYAFQHRPTIRLHTEYHTGYGITDVDTTNFAHSYIYGAKFQNLGSNEGYRVYGYYANTLGNTTNTTQAYGSFLSSISGYSSAIGVHIYNLFVSASEACTGAIGVNVNTVVNRVKRKYQ